VVRQRPERLFSRTRDASQTIGYPLADSAAGQALWIYEKFQAWTDNHGNPEDALAVDAMLDDISPYWFTDTAASSARIYWENTRAGFGGLSRGRIELPMAASVFPHEIFCAPKAWAEALWPNLFYWNELDKGGHFAAFEQPKSSPRSCERPSGHGEINDLVVVRTASWCSAEYELKRRTGSDS
jgi:hypothetical protein